MFDNPAITSANNGQLSPAMLAMLQAVMNGLNPNPTSTPSSTTPTPAATPTAPGSYAAAQSAAAGPFSYAQPQLPGLSNNPAFSSVSPNALPAQYQAALGATAPATSLADYATMPQGWLYGPGMTASTPSLGASTSGSTTAASSTPTAPPFSMAGFNNWQQQQGNYGGGGGQG